MISHSNLEKLVDFHKVDNGYSDLYQFIIVPIDKECKMWELRFFSEVSTNTWHIKVLKDFDDLKNVYHAITDKELRIFKFFATDGKCFINEELYKLHQSELDGKIKMCDKCYGIKTTKKELFKYISYDRDIPMFILKELIKDKTTYSLLSIKIINTNCFIYNFKNYDKKI